VNAGEFVAAKKYLAEVSRHCAAYDDVSTSWHCQLLLGWMHALEGDPKEARLRLSLPPFVVKTGRTWVLYSIVLGIFVRACKPSFERKL
jgi:hypothetical protein